MNKNKSQSKQIRVRFAPSPTGVLHIGSVRTALFNYLFAKQNNGKFILRIEDTDKERSKKEYEEDILAGLKWLGMEGDEFYRQSDRGEVFKKHIQKLIADGKAYVSDETTNESKNSEVATDQEIQKNENEVNFINPKKKEGEKRSSVIRFKNPNTVVTFNDVVRGEIKFDTTELGDFVIAKDEDTPLYHLTVVVDDFEMGITHIIRGEDGISNTPRQILIQEALGAPRPVYCHIPLILAPDKSKLSKRHGAVAVTEYKKLGYLSEAIINFIAFIGWNPGTEKEIYSIDELIQDFSLEKIKKGGAVFNVEKLDSVNKEYLKKLSTDELAEMLIEYLPEELKQKAELDKSLWQKIVEIEGERLNRLSDIQNIELNYFFNQSEYDAEKLMWRQEKDLVNTKEYLEKIIELLNLLDEKDFTSHNIKEKVWAYAEEKGRGNVLWPFRMALSGQDKSPDPLILAEILGKKETTKRLKVAVEKI